ncbi:MAG: (Fe-S)-binding protein [Planctomycetes bacterium]|nr:(Fe-S)-binding protein [Planctomycetota bacterium]
MDDATLVDYAKTLDCIHCGLCLNACPTYKLTGAEPSSPRGRVHLMRSVAEGTLQPDSEFAEEMDFCLLCRACESACPSGVQFGVLMEHTRAGLQTERRGSFFARAARWIGFRVILPSRFALRLVAFVGRSAQRTGLTRFVSRFGFARALRDAPTIPPSAKRALLQPMTPARGEPRGVVGVLQGCMMPELFGRVNRATVAVLAEAGFESRVPSAHVCCGSLHAHNGDREGARFLAQKTIVCFEDIVDASGHPSPIVVNSAGCGAHMKDYAHLFDADDPWHERAHRFAERVVDFSEFVALPRTRAALERRLRDRPSRAQAVRVTWDDPCHLCHAQKIRSEPRALLDLLPGIERVEMRDSEGCCGSAGIYSLLRPDDAAAVLEPKLQELSDTRAAILVTGNPGCQLQWSAGVKRAGLNVRVAHIAELLDEALQHGPIDPADRNA